MAERARTGTLSKPRFMLDAGSPEAVDVGDATHQVLQHLADPPVALGEMLRVLRPGGVIGIREVDWGAVPAARSTSP